MGVLEDAIIKVKEIAVETGKAGGEFIDVSKLKLEASSVKSDIKKDYEALGKMVYKAKACGEDNAEAVETLIKGLDEKHEKYIALKNEIAEHNGEKFCECGAKNAKDAKFCKECGKEL